jgi:hypothetical protein
VLRGFEYALGGNASDDIAELTLAEPLAFDTVVQPIALASAGATPPEGANVILTGFGRQSANSKPNGMLYSIEMTVGFSRSCGGQANAVFVCASAPAGSGCSGDSGSGLASGSTPALVGVMDTVEIVSGESCRDGAVNGFTSTSAPEVRDFIEGSESPPQAPRGGGAIIRAVTMVGHVVTCEPGSWAGSPTFNYAFVDSASKEILQSGPVATYMLTTADVGRTIYCQVSAGNAGGTGVGRTPALSAIEAAPPPPPIFSPPPPSTAPTQSAPGVETSSSSQLLPVPSFQSVLTLAETSLAVQRNGSVTFKLECEGEAACRGEITLQARQPSKKKHGKKARFVTVGHGKFSVVANQTADATLRLNGVGLALLKREHGHLSARLDLVQAPSDEPETMIVNLIEKGPHRLTSRKR